MITFQELIQRLNNFWIKKGVAIQQGYDLEVGAGTFNPATFLRCLGPEPYSAAYVEPSRRPTDGRYGTNPNRVQHYFQYQVMMKPSPQNLQELYLQSLEAIGFDLKEHDIRFVHDDWESPTLGASGLGWEVWMDGMEVTQFTYFQNCGGLSLKPVTGEITYGLERLALYIQKVDSIFDIKWNDTLTYGDIYFRNEVEWTTYNFEASSNEMWFKHFEDYEKESKNCLKHGLVIPAYDFVMKASHAFNMLDARGVISVTERTGYIARVRSLACEVAKAYVKSREEQGFPLIKNGVEPPIDRTTFQDLDDELIEAKPTKKEDFLLEIGSEELPASFVTTGCINLERLIRNLLTKESIPFDEIEMYGTPRRITAVVKGLAMAKPSQEEERRGPAIEVAFNEKGQLTPAGLGFFRSIKKEPAHLSDIKEGKEKDLSIREQSGKDYLFANLKTEGRSTALILFEHLPDLILNVDFPKKMRWSDLDIAYARPLRWIVALFGKHVIPFQIGNITASRNSFGHSQLCPWDFALLKAQDYFHLLKNHKVIPDIAERKGVIEKKLDELEKSHTCQILAREKVLEEVANLTEWPELIVGSFDANFLKVPKEVLISEMVEHQKYFPMEKPDGTLKNQFVITANTKPSPKIKEGNERALSPRLADGLALYDLDVKVSLDSFIEKLKSITFQKDLGTVYDKTERLIKHGKLLQKLLKISTPEKIERAATLSKCDIPSKMIYEFPELQGYMGRYYALAHKENPEVADSIEEHWRPRGEGGELPKTETGILLSLAEKFDNLVGFSLIGIKATSSSDPYALRRQAFGIIKIIIDNQFNLPLKTVLEGIMKHFPQSIYKGKEESLKELEEFFMARVKTVFLDYDVSKDEVEASLSGGIDDIFDTFCKVKALHSFRAQEDKFTKLYEVYRRAKGQIGKENFQNFSESLLVEHAEKELHHHLELSEKPFTEALEKHAYDQAYLLISDIQPHLAKLFDEVKILSDDSKIKANRIALLKRVFDRFFLLLDFGKIRVE